MSTQVNPEHNLIALLLGTGEFSFSENATSAANAQVRGWRDFGNIVALTPDIKPQKLPHVGSYRGVRKVDRQVITQIQTNYKIKVDEWNLENVRMLFGASDTTGFTQPALTVTNGQVLGFTANPATIGLWYDVLSAATVKVTAVAIAGGGTGYTANDVLTVVGGTGGPAATLLVGTVSSGVITAVTVASAGAYTTAPTNPVSVTGGTGSGATFTLTTAALTAAGQQLRNLTTVTIATLIEGTDFVLDLLNGRVKFLTAQALDRTPVVTCSAITSTDDGAFFGLIPMNTPTRRGYGRLTIYDQNNTNIVVMQHYNFSCDITLDTASEIDGTKWNEATIDVLVTSDPGVVYLRQGNKNAGVAS